MRKKGFTLVELLATIVILGLLALLTIPNFIDIMGESKLKTFDVNVSAIIETIQNRLIDYPNLDVSTIDTTYLNQVLNIKTTHIETITVKKPLDTVFVIVKGKNDWAGYTAYGFYNNIQVIETTSYIPSTIAPTITLVGNSTVSVTKGQAYAEPGVNIGDEIDDITYLNTTLKMTGIVNTSISGTYSILYSVIDSSGNYASVSRTVIVS